MSAPPTTFDEQLERWVLGESVCAHLPNPDGTTEKWCCPDFSCCKPELLQPVEVRQAFARADRKVREKYLMHFLGSLLAGSRVPIHIVGGEPEVVS